VNLVSELNFRCAARVAESGLQLDVFQAVVEDEEEGEEEDEEDEGEEVHKPLGQHPAAPPRGSVCPTIRIRFSKLFKCLFELKFFSLFSFLAESFAPMPPELSP